MIAATHQDLEQRVKEGAFREDLFHRLNVIRLRLPALRERREDIPMLTRHFLQQSAKQLGVEPKRISDAALARLATFGFPGNVRQLENICHWLTVMAPAQVIEPKDLPPEVGAVPAEAAAARPLPPAAEAPRPRRAATTPRARRQPLARPAAVRRPAQRPARSWESGLEAEALELLASGRHDVWDELTKRFESQADPHGAGQHARAPHRGRAEARHRPQHHHAQDPGTGSGVRRPCACPRSDLHAVTGAWSLGCFHLRGVAVDARSPSPAGFSASLTRMWSMRRPRFFW